MKKTKKNQQPRKARQHTAPTASQPRPGTAKPSSKARSGSRAAGDTESKPSPLVSAYRLAEEVHFFALINGELLVERTDGCYEQGQGLLYDILEAVNDYRSHLGAAAFEGAQCTVQDMLTTWRTSFFDPELIDRLQELARGTMETARRLFGDTDFESHQKAWPLCWRQAVSESPLRQAAELLCKIVDNSQARLGEDEQAALRLGRAMGRVGGELEGISVPLVNQETLGELYEACAAAAIPQQGHWPFPKLPHEPSKHIDHYLQAREDLDHHIAEVLKERDQPRLILDFRSGVATLHGCEVRLRSKHKVMLLMRLVVEADGGLVPDCDIEQETKISIDQIQSYVCRIRSDLERIIPSLGRTGVTEKELKTWIRDLFTRERNTGYRLAVPRRSVRIVAK